MQEKVESDVQANRHIPALDGVRGFAAAMVFVYHYGGGAQSSSLPVRLIGSLTHFGWAGVSLFFVLSGFLISGILWDGFQRPDWWQRFYLRRSLRIFPLYYLALLIAAIVWLATGVRDLTPMLLYVFYLGDVPYFAHQFESMTLSTPLIHFWSLAVEEQFYILWPFMLLWCNGRRLRAKQLILILWTLSLVFRLIMFRVHAPLDWERQFLLGRAGELLAGAYLAIAIRGAAEEKRRLFRWLPAIFIGSFLLILAISVVSGGPDIESPLMSTAGFAICSLLFASVLGLSLQPGVLQSFFSMPLLRWLGKISYGIYVYNLLLRAGFIWITLKLGSYISSNLSYNGYMILLALVALIGTLSLASLSYYTYESFFLRMKDRLSNSSRTNREAVKVG